MVTSPAYCGKPKEYLTKAKTQQLRNLFMLLCPDSKGCITKDTVSNARISENAYEKVVRIVDELVELDESLNFEEFCKAMEILEKEVNEKNTQNAGVGIEGDE